VKGHFFAPPTSGRMAEVAGEKADSSFLASCEAPHPPQSGKKPSANSYSAANEHLAPAAPSEIPPDRPPVQSSSVTGIPTGHRVFWSRSRYRSSCALCELLLLFRVLFSIRTFEFCQAILYFFQTLLCFICALFQRSQSIVSIFQSWSLNLNRIRTADSQVRLFREFPVLL